jgi:predicted extracellular nuclease
MTKILYKAFSAVTILALMLMALPMQSALAATTIAQWTFESPNTPPDATAATYPNAIVPSVGTGNASGVHVSAATQWTTPAGNGSVDSLSSNNWAVNDYYQFAVSTSNFTAIQVSWDQTRSSTGPATFKLAYSTDGTSFTDFGSPYTISVVTWSSGAPVSTSSFAFDLSAITAIDNQSTVYFRLISTVAAGGTGGTNRVDNFVVSGTPMADVAPSVSSTSPTNGATNVAVNSNIMVTFSENVDATAGAISVECPAGTPVASNAVADNVPSVVIDPAVDLPASTACTINVTASGVTDEDANDPPNTLDANFSASFTTATPPSTSEVVISQIFAGAGCGTAGCSTYTNDYIELYNRSANPVNITGWSVQYASATGTSWQTTALSGTVAPGQYYLVQESGNANGVSPLPTPNATGAIAMGAAAGKVALVNTTTALTATTGCPIASPIVDFVGYGTTANCAEGGANAPAPSTTTAIFRAGNGATDTDNNAADFAVAAPNPRNTPPPLPNLTINDVSLNEGNSGTTTFAFTVSLSSPAQAGGVTFDIATAENTATIADNDFQTNSLTGQSIAAGNSTYTFNVSVNGDAIDEGADETFFVNVSNVTGATLVDAQGVGTIVNDDVDVCTQSFTPVYSIQGSGAATPVLGTSVTTKGVVVGDFEGTASASGFYLQDLTGDANPATSDGIFVLTGSSNLVNIGDIVRVTGFARERFSQTALTGANNDTTAIPAANIFNCGTGSVGATDVSLPFADATFPERYEGMLVRFPQSLVIAEYFNYDRFGEIVLALPLAGESRPFSGTAIDEPGAAANARTAANSLSRITLDDAQSAQNPPALRHPNGATFSLANRFRGGDTVQNAVGVLGFDFSLYRIFPTGAADYTSVNPRPAAPEPVGGTLRVAAMNTLNFFVTLDTTASDSGPGPCGALQNQDCRGADADQPLEFTRQRDKLLTALSGLNADIIGLNELESTPGAEPLDSIVTGMPGYDYIDTGPIGTDAIKVGLIYRPAVVTPVGDFKLLTTTVDPRFIDTKSRPSLAQTFEVNATGARFTVVVNHFKSKGSACNDVGDPDLLDGQGNCSQTRRAAAEALVDWLATDPTGSDDPDFLIVGDLNSYAMEDTIDEIKAGSDDLAGTGDDFTNLIAQFQGTYAYSYTFDGQAGYLDHALANASLLSQVTGATEWHINSDEPDILDYDTSFKPPAQDALYEVNPYRTSDHDAVVVGLDLPEVIPPAVTIDQASGQADPTGNSPINFTVVFSESVTGFTNADVTLSGTAGATTAVVTGGPATYNVAVSGMTANGTVIASIPAGAATDAVGNSSAASTSTDNTVTYSNSAPTITVAAGGMCSASGGTMNLIVSDAEGDTLTLGGSSSNTSAVPNANIVFGGSGTARTVAITAVPASTVRTATLTLTVSDGISSASTTITVVVGTSANNTALNGTSGADLVLGLDGNDTLNGLAGNDLLCGGAKNDILNGGADNDTLFGEQGNDVLTGSTGADSFSGGAGNDTNTDFNAGQGDTSDGT